MKQLAAGQQLPCMSTQLCKKLQAICCPSFGSLSAAENNRQWTRGGGRTLPPRLACAKSSSSACCYTRFMLGDFIAEQMVNSIEACHAVAFSKGGVQRHPAPLAAITTQCQAQWAPHHCPYSPHPSLSPRITACVAWKGP